MNSPEAWMKRCLELAREAAARDEVPVGAIVISQGKIIAEASNQREELQSPSAHAELIALEKAAKKISSWRLEDSTLVTTLEPCVMCTGAIIQSRIQTVIYGASDPKGGAESLFQLFTAKKLNHEVTLVKGVLEEDCSQILKEFFKTKRKG